MADQVVAHKGLIAEPSKTSEKACGFCHSQQVQHVVMSLRVNQNGCWTYLKKDACTACHGNAKIFLTVDAVKANEHKANKNVIVDKVPPKMGQ